MTASGALAPGPLLFGTLVHGSKLGAKAGISTAIGHTVVELPLVLIVALGMIGASTQPVVRQGVSLVGGAALLAFGGLQLRDALKGPAGSGSIASRLPASSFMLGVMFTALNPFFIIWWLTIGSKLVVEGLVLASLAGVLLMYIAHVWMDYAFLGLSAHLAKKGVQLTGSRGFRVLSAVFGVVLIYFGAVFMFSGL